MWIGISAINLALAVMLGAFGAHGLKKLHRLNSLPGGKLQQIISFIMPWAFLP